MAGREGGATQIYARAIDVVARFRRRHERTGKREKKKKTHTPLLSPNAISATHTRFLEAHLEHAHFVSLQLLSDRVGRRHELQDVGSQQVHDTNARVVLCGAGRRRPSAGGSRQERGTLGDGTPVLHPRRNCEPSDRCTPAAVTKKRVTKHPAVCRYSRPSLPFPSLRSRLSSEQVAYIVNGVPYAQR